MDLLQQARAEIDTVDAEMAALFERRMRADRGHGQLQRRNSGKGCQVADRARV